MNKVNINIYLASGFEEIEAIVPADILKRAGFQVNLISVTGSKSVTGAHGITIITDALFEDSNYNNLDMILLPGGMPGSKNLDEHIGLRKAILQHDQNGKDIAAICAAPMVLGHLGLLKEKKACCYPGVEKELEGAIISDSCVAIDGNIITAKGIGSAIDFALAIVEKYQDKASAEKLAKQMLVI